MRSELRAMLSLAWPVILSELGWVLMGIVDTIVVGPLGPAAIGAVGSGSTLFFAVMVLGIGTFFALDTVVSQSYGGGRIDECHRWLYAGLQLAAGFSIVLVSAGLAVTALLPVMDIHPDVLVLLQPYLRALFWSAPPLLLYTVLRRYLQAMTSVRPIMVAMIAANVVNAVGDWALVYGRLGAPALGAIGAAYATFGSRMFLLVALAGVVVLRERGRPGGLFDVPFVLDVSRMSRLIGLGSPAAGQIVLEVGVFAAATALAARMAPAALAAHQIVLHIASFFFMIPYALSSAAAVRVGHAVGRGDGAGASRAGWAALLLALGFALAIATLFIGAPQTLLHVFTHEPSVLAVGVTLLIVCSVFQPFDGFQVVATGALRGLGDTRTPMLANLVGHWLLGLPVAYVLCFSAGLGVTGLWIGLSLGLIVIGATLTLVWHRRTADRGQRAVPASIRNWQ
jgi:MATE family multidrug resistance protein